MPPSIACPAYGLSPSVQSIAVEVSHSSRVTDEAKKLRRVPVTLRLIVTTDPYASGEIGGISGVAHTKLDDKVIRRLRQTHFCYKKGCDFWTRNPEQEVRHRKWHAERELDEWVKRSESGDKRSV